MDVRNLKLMLEYDGTDFVGWQVQRNGRTVQGVLQETITRIVGQDVDVIGAGRTDSGVHARGQVANFHTSRTIDPSSLRAALNSQLPQDVVVHSVEEADPRFHARYDAKARKYRYQITTALTALERRFSWYVKYHLNVALMNRAASMIVGEREFDAFCKVDADRNHSRAKVFSACWTVEGSRLSFEVWANRFLRGMVRALVGTMVDVGRGYTSLGQFDDFLASRNPDQVGMYAPPNGLFLEEVCY